MQKPNVYLVGAGPGDVGLITARGLELLRRADVVLYDFLANPALLGETRADCERIYVGKKAHDPANPQCGTNELLVEKGKSGALVVRLKGGDPFIFGRGAEECEALTEAGIAFEVVPGVTAGFAAPAYAGIPLTAKGLAGSITFVTGHRREDAAEKTDWAALARLKGTLAIYMGMARLAEICAALADGGLDGATPAAIIEWATLPRQRSLLSTLSELPQAVEKAGLGSPSMVVIGEVARFHRHFNWYEGRPLFGRRVAITRDAEGNAGLAARLLELGAEPVLLPLIRITPPDAPRHLEEALESLERFDWVAFTSVHAVRNFMDCLRRIGLDARALGGVKVAAVGAVTAGELEQRGIVADAAPGKRTGAAALARRICEGSDVRGARVLFPCADIAREELPNALRTAGAHVERVVAYHTRPHRPENFDEIADAMARGEIDAALFASSSAAQTFAEFAGAERFAAIAEKVCLAAIGASTRDTLALLGAPNAINNPDDYSLDGMLETLARHFAADKM